jgi:hypothetical protein
MDFCCVEMAGNAENQCASGIHDRQECPDCLIHVTRRGEFGIMIKDGGTSFSLISFCPWCGADLTRGSVTRGARDAGCNPVAE